MAAADAVQRFRLQLHDLQRQYPQGLASQQFADRIEAIRARLKQSLFEAIQKEQQAQQLWLSADAEISSLRLPAENENRDRLRSRLSGVPSLVLAGLLLWVLGWFAACEDLSDAAGKTIFGEVFARQPTPGLASYHFDSPGSSYIQYGKSADEVMDIKLDDGTSLPHKNYFVNAYFDEESRTFSGVVDWSPTSIHGQERRWEYHMVFDEELDRITDGRMVATFVNGTSVERRFSDPTFKVYQRVVKAVTWESTDKLLKQPGEAMPIDARAFGTNMDQMFRWCEQHAGCVGFEYYPLSLAAAWGFYPKRRGALPDDAVWYAPSAKPEWHYIRERVGPDVGPATKARCSWFYCGEQASFCGRLAHAAFALSVVLLATAVAFLLPLWDLPGAEIGQLCCEAFCCSQRSDVAKRRSAAPPNPEVPGQAPAEAMPQRGTSREREAGGEPPTQRRRTGAIPNNELRDTTT